MTYTKKIYDKIQDIYFLMLIYIMYYFKFRYTFTDDRQDGTDKFTSQDKGSLRALCDFIKDYSQGKMTAGLECRNKTGEITKKHVHIHFISDKVRDTIAKRFVRIWMNENQDFRKKSQAYSLKAEADINEQKFWRYPFKEIKDGYKRGLHAFEGFTDEEYKEFNAVAHAQRLTQYEIVQTKVSKKEDQTFVEKFCSYLDTKDVKEHKEIFVELFNFYISQNKPLNQKQLKDYSYLYMAKKGYLTPDEFYNLR